MSKRLLAPLGRNLLGMLLACLLVVILATSWGSHVFAQTAGPAPNLTATATVTPTPTATASPTATSTPTAPATPTPSPTATATATATPSATATATPTPAATATYTSTPAATATATATQTPSATATPAQTATAIPTATSTPTAPATPTPSPTATATATATPSATATATPTPTQTPVGTQAHFRVGKDRPLTDGNKNNYYYAPVDTAATGIPRSTNFRLRFQVYNDGATDNDWRPQLEWSATSGSGYAAVPTTSGTDPFFVTDTAEFSNGDSISTGDFGLGTGTGTAQAGRAYDAENPAGAAITLAAGSYTEVEFNLQANSNAAYGTTYYFRLTNAGSPLAAYEAEARFTMETLAVTFGRVLSGARVGQHKAPPTSSVGMEVSATVDKPVASATLIDLFPSDWTVTDAQGGTVSAVDANTNKIEWTVGALAAGGTATKNYTLLSPALTTPPTDYQFVSQLSHQGGAATSSAWTVQVADPPGSAKQAHYRIGNDTPLDSMTWKAATDTTATGIQRNANFRVRFQLYNDSNSDYDLWPQLEWSATSGSAYAAVPTSSGSTPFYVANTSQFGNRDTIDKNWFALGAGTGGDQDGIAYDTENPTGNKFTLRKGKYTEIEFNVQANSNAAYATNYYFRLTNAGSPLAAYDVQEAVIQMETGPTAVQAHFRIGDDTPLGAMTWKAATDTTATGIQRNANFRVRFQLYNSTGSAYSWQPQLEYSPSPSSGYQAVPTTSGSIPFFVTDTAEFSNGATISTTDFALGSGTGTARDGLAYDTENPPASASTLEDGRYTEIEFNVQANDNAVYGKTYYFRLTNGGLLLQSYEQVASISMETTGIPHTGFAEATPKCAECHRTHRGAGPNLRKTWPEEGLCYTCHDGTTASTDMQSLFGSKTYKHTIAAQSGVHLAGESGSTAFSNRHVECEDCHNPHDSNEDAPSAPTAQGPVRGATGVSPDNGASAGAPASFTWLDPISNEYELCFKCHSSYTSGYTGGDKAAEFNTNNPSYHPVEGTGANLGIKKEAFTAGSGWDTQDYSASSPKVYCSDCHGSDSSADPQGPHGSSIQYILRDNYSHTSSSQTAQALCYNCHKYDVYYNGQTGSRFNKHRLHVSKKGFSCYVCHDEHGSSTRPHLISGPTITNFTHDSGGGTCWADNSVYNCHGGGSKNYNHQY